MARVQVATQGWGWLVDSSGSPRSAATVSIDVPVYEDSSSATVLVAADGEWPAGSNGVLPGWVEEGTHTLTDGGDEYTVEAVRGGLRAPGIPAGKLAAWFDASVSLAALADGTAVASWQDIGEAAQDATQLTAAAKPTKQTYNSKAVARFASGQFLRSTGLGPFAQPLTLVAVCKPSSANTNIPMVFGGNDTSLGARLLFASQASSSGYPYGYAGSNGGNARGPGVQDDAWHVVVAVLGTLDYRLYIDGVLIDRTPTQGHGSGGLRDLTIGDLNGTSNQYLGDIAELMVATTALTPADVDTLSTSLGAKWGITVGRCGAPVVYSQTTQANGQAARIWLPRTLASPSILVLYSHPAGHNEQIGNSPFSYWADGLPAVTLSNGWALAASNMHGDSWGNSTAQADLLDLYNTMVTLMGAAPSKVILVGASMGGIASLIAVAQGTIPNIKGVYLLDGAADLANMYANASYTAAIKTAYGIAADGSDYASKTSGYDPMLRTTSDYAGKRYRFNASTADTVVPKADHADAMITKLGATVPEASLRTHNADAHLGGSLMSPLDFSAFVDRC